MRFLSRHKSSILWFFVGLTFGFLIYCLPYISFENKINPLDITNIFLTIILALIIGLYIEPATESNRIEKDLFINQLNEAKNAAITIHEIIVTHLKGKALTEEVKGDLRFKFKALSNQIYHFEDMVIHCNRDTDCTEVKVLYFFYKKAITGYDFDNINFSFSFIFSEYEGPYMKLVKEINHTIIKINRS